MNRIKFVYLIYGFIALCVTRQKEEKLSFFRISLVRSRDFTAGYPTIRDINHSFTMQRWETLSFFRFSLVRSNVISQQDIHRSVTLFISRPKTTICRSWGLGGKCLGVWLASFVEFYFGVVKRANVCSIVETVVFNRRWVWMWYITWFVGSWIK